MANFFIDRPIFASGACNPVVSDGCPRRLLPFLLSNTPTSRPPTCVSRRTIPGASAQTLENTVTQVIEQNMTGLDNLMYMSSQSSATGRGDGNPELYGGHGSG